MAEVDPAFDGAGQHPGTEIWRIEDFCPVPLPKADYGKFYAGDSYIVLQTTETSSGALEYALHFWLGKDTSQDEAGAAAIKTVELDQALGDKAVQYRECQGNESDLFLSHFKAPIIPLAGGVASGFKKVEEEEFETRLFVIKGTRGPARVTQLPVVRESLSHDDVFILDTKDKIFQFNGDKSSISERGKAMEVVQHVKETSHEGSCDVAIIDDDGAEAEEFWALFGGVGPVGEKAAEVEAGPAVLLSVVDGQVKELEEASNLQRDVLKTDNCYVLDVGTEFYLWVGKEASLQQKKDATLAVEEYIRSQKRPSSTRVTRLFEDSELPIFKQFFQEWS